MNRKWKKILDMIFCIVFIEPLLCLLVSNILLRIGINIKIVLLSFIIWLIIPIISIILGIKYREFGIKNYIIGFIILPVIVNIAFYYKQIKRVIEYNPYDNVIEEIKPERI